MRRQYRVSVSLSRTAKFRQIEGIGCDTRAIKLQGESVEDIDPDLPFSAPKDATRFTGI